MAEQMGFSHRPSSPRILSRPVGLVFCALFILIGLFLVFEDTSVQRDRWDRLSSILLRGSQSRPAARIALVGFVAREGSSWFMDLLRATQNLSRTGKICVMGFEPLDHLDPDKFPTSVQQWNMRKEFYMKLTEINNENEQRFLDWLTDLNENVLRNWKMGRLRLNETCDWRSRVFIFKARLHNHFDLNGFTPEDSVWFESFSERLRQTGGKIIHITRHAMLHRAATDHRGQFQIRDADSEDQIEAVKEANAQLHVDPALAHQDIVNYISVSDKLARVIRSFRVPSLTIHYENLVESYASEISEVMKFLEIPYENDLELLKGESRFQKVSPARLCEKVENFREYCSYFQATRFAGLLDEACDSSCKP